MSRPSPSTRPTYTTEQIERHLDQISFPKDDRITPDTANTAEGLRFLQRLIKYQLARVPFENLDLHYSPHRAVSLDPDHLYEKIVTRQSGRGGYCMQNNTFFGSVLRGLGFSVLPVGARVNSAADAGPNDDADGFRYGAFTHTVNIVSIAGTRYFVDVGFGARGPTSAIPLEHGQRGRNTGDETGGTTYCVRREHIPENTQRTAEQLLWTYSVRYTEGMQWLPIYCFSELEFLPGDLAMASFYVSKSLTSFFTYTVVCASFVMDPDTEEIVGDKTLAGTNLKTRRYGKAHRLCEINSESDRVEALKEYFGIILTPAEINGIKGMVTMIS